MAKLVKLQTQQNMLYTPTSSDYVLVTTGLDSQGNVTQLVKKSDGTFATIGGGGGSSAVLGMVDAQGKFQALSFQGTTASNSGDPEAVTSFYSWNGTLPVPQTGGSSDGYVVVEEDGVLKAQKLSFNGTEASFDGTAETLDTTKVGLFATTQDEPAYKGVPMGGGAFYKCISVDTETEWSGQQWVLREGIYVLDESITTGLPYGTGFTPAVGKSYNADATVRVDKMFEGASAVPDAGLVFYLPFNGNAEPVEGSVTSMTGELTYGESNGIGYAVFDESQTLNVQLNSDVPSAYTIAVTFLAPALPSSTFGAIMYHQGSLPTNIVLSADQIRVASGSYDAGTYEIGRFYNVIMTAAEGDVTHTYINGVESTNTSASGTYRFEMQKTFHIGSYGNDSSWFNGYLADVAIWNRVLTEEEIAHITARAASMNG